MQSNITFFNTPTVIWLGAISWRSVEKSSLLQLYQADYFELHLLPQMLPSKKKVTITYQMVTMHPTCSQHCHDHFAPVS